jgi:hypothetical protein
MWYSKIVELGPFSFAFVIVISPFSMIQVDIGGHPPSPTGPKHVSGNFGNLLFLAVFSGPELPGPF